MTTPQLLSKRASSFKKLYAQLPEKVQQEADEAYRQFRADPDYPGLHFKQIVWSYYSVRVGGGHRALAVRRVGYCCGSGSERTPTTIASWINCAAADKASNK